MRLRSTSFVAGAAVVSMIAGAMLVAMAVPSPGNAYAQERDDPAKKAVVEASREPLFSADDGPELTDAQAALAARITTLITPSDGAKPASSGVPPELALGIVGFYEETRGHFTVVIGSNADQESLVRTMVAGLPTEAASALRVVRSDVSTEALARVWNDVAAAQWRTSPSSYAIVVDPKSARIELAVSQLTAGEKDRLAQIGGSLLHVVVEPATVRDTRNNDSTPQRTQWQLL